MAIHAKLHHSTRYTYDRPVALGPQIIRLRPAPHCRTKILAYSLKVTPENHFVNWQQDPHGNWLARLVFPEKTDEFSIEVDLIADLAVDQSVRFLHRGLRRDGAFPLRRYELAKDDLPPISTPTRPDRAASLSGGLAERTVRNGRFSRRAQHRPPGENPLRRSAWSPASRRRKRRWRLARAPAATRAWLLVQLLRHLGFAARFVSGYLIQFKPDVKALDGPSGTDHDFTDLHAWAEVYLPGAGWVGLDPTSGLFAGEGHIPLAATPHYRLGRADLGRVEPARSRFRLRHAVTRIDEPPRVTMPFTDEAWAELDALGDKVDADLQKQDVRLTMGGEPTFVSIDDFQSAEWNTAAVGPTKRGLADTLIRRLRDAFAPGGLLHYGQGKWYPGEMPAALGLRALLAQGRRADLARRRTDRRAKIAQDPDRRRAAHDATTASWRRRRRRARHSAHDVSSCRPMRIRLTWLLKEAELPDNVDAARFQAGRPGRARPPGARVRARASTSRSGYRAAGAALERAAARQPGWISEHWTSAARQLVPVPGDSPVGFRLPLASLPYVPPAAYPYIRPQPTRLERARRRCRTERRGQRRRA